MYNRVSKSIHLYLQGKPLNQPSTPAPPVGKSSRVEIAQRVQSGEIKLQPRVEPALLSMEERVTSFREVVL
ncbi:MAG: hypothetical protein U9Q82_06875 [Chloroflexota bacterium]|nr:hypothetical protein [Chloroflexota bacterium]